MKCNLPDFTNSDKNNYKLLSELIVDALTHFKMMVEIDTPVWSDINSFNIKKNRVIKLMNKLSHLNNVDNGNVNVNENTDCAILFKDFELTIKGVLYFKFLNRIDKSFLSDVQLRLLERDFLDFRLNGFYLSLEERDYLLDLKSKLSILSSRFRKNVIYGLNRKIKVLRKGDLIGLSEVDLSLLSVDCNGNYLLSLKNDYVMVMRDCENRELRKRMYLEYNGIASVEGSFNDNTLIMESILRLRERQSKLLGFNNYAELSLCNKSIGRVEDVFSFLDNQLESILVDYNIDMDKLCLYAGGLGIEDFNVWDHSYVIKKYNESNLKLSYKELSEYFTIDNMLEGFYDLMFRFFNIKVIEVIVPNSYSDDLRLLEFSIEGNKIGYVYCDLMRRNGKKNGSWMSLYTSDAGDSLPISMINCNMKFYESKTLDLNDIRVFFHEMGHALHNILSDVSGVDLFCFYYIEMDSIEFPSNLMEMFGMDVNFLHSINKHYKTNEVLSLGDVSNMLDSFTSFKSLSDVRQLELSILDMKMHMGCVDINSMCKDFNLSNNIIELDEGVKYYNSFHHIFAGSYSAGYYGYKWSSVLASEVYKKIINSNLKERDLGLLLLDNVFKRFGSENILSLCDRFNNLSYFKN